MKSLIFLNIRSLPAGVVDIDKKDYENPQLCAEYTQDMYAYLRLKAPISVQLYLVMNTN